MSEGVVRDNKHAPSGDLQWMAQRLSEIDDQERAQMEQDEEDERAAFDVQAKREADDDKYVAEGMALNPEVIELKRKRKRDENQEDGQEKKARNLKSLSWAQPSFWPVTSCFCLFA
jgi:hypothetical protein